MPVIDIAGIEHLFVIVQTRPGISIKISENIGSLGSNKLTEINCPYQNNETKHSHPV
jgi:hypothetical protein